MASFLADGAGPNRRQAAAASLAASLAPLAAPGAARAESMEEAAAAQAASRVSVGLTGDDLVLPAYFAGDWAVAGELYKVETGPLGQGALTSALPGVQEALRKNSLAVGAPAGEFRARRRWKKCSRTAPGGGAGVEEERGSSFFPRVAWSLPTSCMPVRISDCRSLYDLLTKDGVAAAERRLTLDEAIKESAEHMEPEAAILV
ncbi:unnamed protein product [Effrenium voratum]|uniref:Uncharacterized protein n=1 Tax=Effrenium voratum TaxID=2562239 RepID=A0AA36N4C4_9DINO|nr:unnamed protein product [Effrenium voratum]